jgi:hypothetical protein
MIVVENPETGEVRELLPNAQGHYPNMRVPWRAKDPTSYRRCPHCGNQGLYDFRG